jgi:hypothetical protein
VAELVDTLERAIQLLNQPSVRALSVVIAIASFLVSIWAVRRISVVMTSHGASLLSEQARFIETQWKAIDENVLANPESAKLLAEMFGLDSEAEARREAFHLMFLNTLSMAFVGWKHRVIDLQTYDGHMRYFFFQYKGKADYISSLVKRANYPSGFLSECERYLALARRAAAPVEASSQEAKSRGQLLSPAQQTA